MTVTELANAMLKLISEGKGDDAVFITTDNRISFPLKEITSDKVDTMSIVLVVLRA